MKKLHSVITYAGRYLFAGSLLLLTAGCVTVPQQSLDAYRSSFSAAKTASEEIVLRGKVAAQALAENPLNPQTPSERLARLAEREQDAAERLLALNTIDSYNTVLVLLAEGKDPEAIKSNLEKLGTGLSLIASGRIATAVGKAVPYAGIAAEVIALVDETANRQRFFEVVRKGREPVCEIIDNLSADADSIYTIVSQQMLMQRDVADNRLSDLRFRFLKVADGLKSTSDLAAILNSINDAREQLAHRKLPAVAPREGAREPQPSDLELLDLLVDATQKEVAAANAVTAKDKGQRHVIEEYKKLLKQTKISLTQMEKAIELNRPAAAADFINRALALREAVIKLREGV